MKKRHQNYFGGGNVTVINNLRGLFDICFYYFYLSFTQKVEILYKE
ncbi:hypothetical protein BN131_857 [Cronobacter malonaticus 681]|nr:hypothetical protein BN131_857 [Cronobacter malonaticus 681]